jgi:hypothetical protein
MCPVQKPHSKKPGGKLKVRADVPAEANFEERESKPPLKNVPAEFGIVRPGKNIVVHDDKGQLVSVTRVSSGSPYGVGVKPGPGHVMKEYDAEDLRDALEPPNVEDRRKPPKKR